MHTDDKLRIVLVIGASILTITFMFLVGVFE